ncbi:MAG: response regulator [Phormidesmis sp.]
MKPEQQQRIMGYFIEEAKDHLNTIEQGLLSLQSTIEDAEKANELFRAAHSVKGGAAMLGLESIQQTAHRMEDYFKILKESPVRVDRALETMFLRVSDGLKDLLEQLEGPFGLTQDKAQEIMADVEPVFDQLEQHLKSLVGKANALETLAEPNAADEGSSSEALQSRFKRDVAAWLRQMLAAFKQRDTPATRESIQDTCAQLTAIGNQFELAAWCDLTETARLAASNLDNDYRRLAPILIKEIKKAQDLVLSGRAAEVSICDTLQALLPEDILAANIEASDGVEIGANADSLELNGLETDLAGTQNSSEGSLNDVLAEDLFEEDGFEENISLEAPAGLEDLFLGNDTSIADDVKSSGAEANSSAVAETDFEGLFGNDSAERDGTDSSNDGLDDIGRLSLDLDFDEIPLELSTLNRNVESEEKADESLDALLATVNVTGPDVGTEELNSLADLFDGDLEELDNTLGGHPFISEEMRLHPEKIDSPAEDLTDFLDNESVNALDIESTSDSEAVDDDLFGGTLSEGAFASSDDLDLPELDDFSKAEPTISGQAPASLDSVAAIDEAVVSEDVWAEDAWAEDRWAEDGDREEDTLFGSSDTLDNSAESDDAAELDPSQDLFSLEESPKNSKGEYVSPTHHASPREVEIEFPTLTGTKLQEAENDIDSFFLAEPADSTFAKTGAKTDDAVNKLLFDLDEAENRENAPVAMPTAPSGQIDDDPWGELSIDHTAVGTESERNLADLNWPEEEAEPTEEREEGADEQNLGEASIEDDLEDAFLGADLSSLVDPNVEVERADSELDDLLDFSEENESSEPMVATPGLAEAVADDLWDELAGSADSLDDETDFLTDDNSEAVNGSEAKPVDEVATEQTEKENAFDEISDEVLADFETAFGSFSDEDNINTGSVSTETTEDTFDLTDDLTENSTDDLFDLSEPASLAEEKVAAGEEALPAPDQAAEEGTDEAAISGLDVDDIDDAAVVDIDNLEIDDLLRLDLWDGLPEDSSQGDGDESSAQDLRDRPAPSESSEAEHDAPILGVDGFLSAEEFDLEDDFIPDETENVADDFEDDFEDDFDGLDALLAAEEEEAEALADEDMPTFVGVANEAAAETRANADAVEEDEDFGDLEKLLEDGSAESAAPTTPLRRAPQRIARRGGGVREQNMRVSVTHLDNLSNLVGELVVSRNTLERDQERLRQFLDNLLFQVQQLNDVGQRMRDLYERSLLESSLLSNRRAHATGRDPGERNHATGEIFDALEMDRFTGFHTLSQEMIELIVRVRESSSDIGYTVESSDQVTRQFRQITTQLQEGLNTARMVAFSQAADRLPRAVRDISLKCGKEARLIVEGQDTLVDKMIVENLYDPLTHLVNNAITHGIETPEERKAAGKQPEGSITVRAFYQGNQTVIYVADDGGGINTEFVKRKAIEKNLISQAEADNLSALETYELLFHPGFSTRDQADDFAGRGVGMDVVRTSLADIRGSVTVDSELGKGTSFTIRLPLTLSISKALSCVSNQARIAFPMDGVEDMLDVPRDRVIKNEQGKDCVRWRDNLLPFQPVTDLLKFNRTLGRGRVYGGSQDDDVLSVIVLRSANTYVAIQVDQVIGEEEIVIKQLEGPVPKPLGIAGATVLGDGRVMPIADVLELIDIAMGRIRREPSSMLWSESEVVEETPAKSEPTVLIVDDSITVRELLSMSFNKVGYRVEQARDGQEAWDKLRSGLPCDLVFCDIEMPRMDGLELLSRMQKDNHLKSIPIAMLTSRGADRHRQMAVDLGASGYFTKPYLEEALLDAAQRMLNGETLAKGRGG